MIFPFFTPPLTTWRAEGTPAGGAANPGGHSARTDLRMDFRAGLRRGRLTQLCNGTRFRMIQPAWVRTMAAYNSEMNRRIYAAAGTLPDAERRADRGAFFGGIHATLNHLVWGDSIWMSRFAGWEPPVAGIAGSTSLHEGWEELCAVRRALDARIEAWAAGLGQADLDRELVWTPRSAPRGRREPLWFTLTHFFNHQTHHRGQVHALLTRAGAKTEDTDLTAVVRAESQS